MSAWQIRAGTCSDSRFVCSVPAGDQEPITSEWLICCSRYALILLAEAPETASRRAYWHALRLSPDSHQLPTRGTPVSGELRERLQAALGTDFTLERELGEAECHASSSPPRLRSIERW